MDYPVAEHLWKLNMHSCGVQLVAAQNNNLIEFNTSDRILSHSVVGMLRDLLVQVKLISILCHCIFPFDYYHWDCILSWRLLAMPFMNNHALILSDMKDGPRLESTYPRYLITVDVATFFTGKANRNLECSSTILRRNGLFLERKGPLKSIDTHS